MAGAVNGRTSVRTAGAADAETIGRILGAGFEDDPVLSWAFEDPGRRQKLEAMFGHLAAHAGWTWYLDDAGAAAGWIPRGADLSDDSWSAGMVEAMSMATADDWTRLAAVNEAMEAAHPTEPHWYLPAIATLPDRRGRGLGSGLLSHALLAVDRDRSPAYLESSNPRNITLYERHGFEVAGRIDIDDGVFMTPMWRP